MSVEGASTTTSMSDVERLLAYREVENLLHTYAARIDAGDFAGVAELFRHGRIAASIGAPEGSGAEGFDAVLTQYRTTTRLLEDGTPGTRHLTTNVRLRTDDARGWVLADSCFTVLQRTDALALQPIITGRYEDAFHRIDGVWWFHTRVMHVDLLGDLSQHLLIDLG